MSSALAMRLEAISLVLLVVGTNIGFSEIVTEKHDYGFVAPIFYEARKNWKTSNLGSILFKNESPDKFGPATRNFTVLLWKYWDAVKGVNLRNIQALEKPLQECSVQNCVFTNKIKTLTTADAVIISMREKKIPKKRTVAQRWILWNDEPPTHNLNLKKYVNLFNWTMTYRSDSDVPIPYGRTLPLQMPLIDDVSDDETLAELVPNWDKKRWDVIAAVMLSDCAATDQMNFVSEIQKHMKIHFFGECSNEAEVKRSCPGKNWRECKLLNNYLFYFVLEKSRCRQYLTDKSFLSAYAMGAIPIIRGPLLEDCEKLLPSNSFIHVDSYKNVEQLVTHIKKIAKYNDTLLWYHRWRNYYETVEEYGNVEKKSLLFCRVCEALNYNDKAVKIYDEDELRLFFDARLICDKPLSVH